MQLLFLKWAIYDWFYLCVKCIFVHECINITYFYNMLIMGDL